MAPLMRSSSESRALAMMARLPLVKPMKAFSASSRQLERKDMRIAIRAFRSDTSRASSLSSSCFSRSASM